MALRFSSTADITLEVVITSDSSVSCDEKSVQAYLTEGDKSGLNIGEDATVLIIKPLSLEDRERAEIRAGAHTRSELGRYLSERKPQDPQEYARWHHDLSEDEREALGKYQNYLNKCYYELVRSGLVSIKGIDGDAYDVLMTIQPEAVRVATIMELVCHIQRLSLLSDDEKKN